MSLFKSRTFVVSLIVYFFSNAIFPNCYAFPPQDSELAFVQAINDILSNSLQQYSFVMNFRTRLITNDNSVIHNLNRINIYLDRIFEVEYSIDTHLDRIHDTSMKASGNNLDDLQNIKNHLDSLKTDVQNKETALIHYESSETYQSMQSALSNINLEEPSELLTNLRMRLEEPNFGGGERANILSELRNSLYRAQISVNTLYGRINELEARVNRIEFEVNNFETSANDFERRVNDLGRQLEDIITSLENP